MLNDQIINFLESGFQNQWLSIGNLELYVRKSVRMNPRFRRKHEQIIRCFDVANVSCGQKGCGEFTTFFNSLKSVSEYGFQAIYIEQVLGNRFADYFRRLGCVETNALGAIPSFFYFLGE